jgi:hypothetical protein
MPAAVTNKHLRNSWLMMFHFSDKKCSFFSQLKYPHQNLVMRQPTNFGTESQRFKLATHVIAEQFKKSGI